MKEDYEKSKFTFANAEYDLTVRQKLFAMNYVRLGCDGSKAAIESGYSSKNPHHSACMLLAIPDVSRFVEALKRDLATVLGISAVDIAREYAKIGMSDIRKIFDPDGALISITKFDDQSAGNVSSIEVFEVRDSGGKKIGETKKIKLYNKIDALDKLATMLGVNGVQKTAITDAYGNSLPQDDPLKVGEGQVLRIHISGRKDGK